MAAAITLREFQYRNAMGDTSDYLVPGLGLVKHKQSIGSFQGYNFQDQKTVGSRYLVPESNVYVDQSKNYEQAVSDLIFDYMVKGNVLYHPFSDDAEGLEMNFNIDIEVDTNNNKVTVRAQNGINQYKWQSSITDMTGMILDNPPRTRWAYFPPNSENNSYRRPHPNYDYMKRAKDARKHTGWLLGIQKSFQDALQRALTYNRNYGGRTALVRLFDYSIPDWKMLGKYTNKHLITLFQFEMSVAKIAKFSKTLKGIGYVGIGGTAIYAGLDIIENGWSLGRIVDGVMLGCFFVSNPWIAGAATVYFIADGISYWTTDKGVGDHINDLVDYLF